jgi:CheY-like chemotaxis protein
MKAVYLVIDSNDGERRRLAVGLRQFVPGSDVIEAANGLDAIRALDERGVAPSLVFTTFQLSDMNAVELLGRLRQTAWLQLPPAMIVDDDIADRHVIDCYRLGASGFLRKPVLGFELREAVKDFSRASFTRTGNGQSGERLAA